MIHAVALGGMLYVLWLLLSGYWTDGLLLSLGAVSTVLCVLTARRMGIVDREGVPIRQAIRAVTYWPWLAWQVILSNITVAKIILNPKLPISPTLAIVPYTQKTDLGQVIFANSITLTPGTISVDMALDGILVHALEGSGIDDLMEGEMDRRVTAFEGER
ncbi:MAG: Na+/H+ antiporter subunit E [Rhodospirillum sp.]|nr:Na+/H+ antiporter subunit E [Rhodospirillum sp.]MCF8487827.1 Na+/H+ antiporter subunit E [Rhodospirillum sp.]MCF8502892.1 Na+/H+ antiporter subunit E [Rhodospirillum sp.]